MRWDALVFDLDDTLYPERQYVRSGMWAVSEWVEANLDFAAYDCYEELCALEETAEPGRVFDRWIQLHGLRPDDWVGAMVTVYRRHAPEIRPYPEVQLELERLAAGFRLGLVSDGYQEAQEKKWTALKLAPYFEAVVFSDKLGRENWKPSPLPFRTVIERLGVRAERAVYIGDNPYKDFLGARAIGMQTIRMRRPDGRYHMIDLPSPHGVADAEARNLGEIDSGLEQIRSGRCLATPNQ